MAEPSGATKPLCGYKWLNAHLYDYTHDYILSLSLEVSIDGKRLPPLRTGNDRKHRKEVLEIVKERS